MNWWYRYVWVWAVGVLIDAIAHEANSLQICHTVYHHTIYFRFQVIKIIEIGVRILSKQFRNYFGIINIHFFLKYKQKSLIKSKSWIILIWSYFLYDVFSISECSENTYGTQCLEKCACNLKNSLNSNQTCDHVSGQCQCGTGWTGLSCEIDINECLNSSICQHLQNSGCTNIEDGYECACLRGFKMDSNKTCVKGE